MSRLRVLGGVLAAFAVVLVTAAGAQAHVTFTGSNPADGSRTATLPTSLTLRFTEELSPPAAVVLTAPDGSTTTAGEPRIDGQDVVVDLDPGAGESEGTYAVAFRVVSVDGHPVSGRFTFVVGDGPLEDVASGSATVTTGDGTSGTPAAASSAADPTDTGRGLSLTQVQVAVAVVLFGVAGLLVLLARRQSDDPSR